MAISLLIQYLMMLSYDYDKDIIKLIKDSGNFPGNNEYVFG